MGLPLGPIQTLPQGLTGLLNLKNLGRVPDELAGFYQPTVDGLPFWLRERAETNNALVHGNTITTGGYQTIQFSPTPIQVPAGEVWYFHEYSVLGIIPAAATDLVNNMVPALFYNTVGTINYAALAEPVSWVGKAAYQTGMLTTGRDFWAPPGSALGVIVGEVISAAGVAVAGRYRVTKIRI